MVTGGQFSSGAGPSGLTIGTSFLAVPPPPNQLLNLSVSDCADAVGATPPQPTASNTAVDVASLR
jgi:hypothetical protein